MKAGLGWGFWASVACAVACSHGQGVSRSDSASGASRGTALHQGAASGEQVTVFDLNHDGKPDVWDYMSTTKGADGTPVRRLVRKELDVNFDGKPDIVRFYDDHEQLTKELLDLDFDGKVDQENDYEHGQLVRKERMLQGGEPDEWIYFEKGQIVRKEKSVHCGSGRVDYWEYWENGQVDRVGEDLDCDGKVDRWTKTPSSAG
jgi:hypothetical protein